TALQIPCSSSFRLVPLGEVGQVFRREDVLRQVGGLRRTTGRVDATLPRSAHGIDLLWAPGSEMNSQLSRARFQGWAGYVPAIVLLGKNDGCKAYNRRKMAGGQEAGQKSQEEKRRAGETPALPGAESAALASSGHVGGPAGRAGGPVGQGFRPVGR